MKQIFIDVRGSETRVALKEDGELVELYFERPIKENLVGNIYIGRVSSVLPGMQAGFIDIGYERNAFLYLSDAIPKDSEEDISDKNIDSVIKAGQEIIVQVSKEAIGTKGPKATTHITLPGKYFVLTPNTDFIGVSLKIEDEEERERLKEISKKLISEGVGVIVRTDAKGKSKKSLTKDLKKLFEVWEEIEAKIKENGKVPRCVYRERDITFKSIRDLFSQNVDKLVINDLVTYTEIKNYLKEVVPEYMTKLEIDEDIDLFDKHNIEPYIKNAVAKKVWLNCGGYIVIDKTEALTAIDVNTGKYIGNSSLEETVTKTNCEAAKEIAKQLRLRDISGIIIVDFIDMQNETNKERILEILKEELKKDRTKTNIIGMTGLGLIEITRKKTRQGLDRSILKDCPQCSGTGKVFSQLFLASAVEKRIERIASKREGEHLIIVNNEMADLFSKELNENIKLIEKKWNVVIKLKASKELTIDEIVVIEGDD